jgi:hypothetical protein
MSIVYLLYVHDDFFPCISIPYLCMINKRYICDVIEIYRRIGRLVSQRVLCAGNLLVQPHHFLLQLLDVRRRVHDY